MIIYTDSVEYAAQILGGKLDWQKSRPQFDSPGLVTLVEYLYQDRYAYSTTIKSSELWRYLFMVEKAPQSQFDIVVDLCKRNIEVPDGVLCLAGSGESFHGLRNRDWAALPGNIHLTANLRPNLQMAETGIGFTILSAVSVIDTIDKIPGLEGRAMIKWVNDIFISDAKVSGFLTHTMSLEGLVTSAVIGIGLNVETTPQIELDPTIYRAISLKDLETESGGCNQQLVFEHLIVAFEKNYYRLKLGQLPELLDKYRNRSEILGREVEIIPDSPHDSGREVIRGKVVGIGENLELYLEGRETPITRGRLVLIS